MFNNIGKKIKKIARMQSILFVFYNFFGGVILFFYEEVAFLGWLLIIIAIFGTPVSAVILYGLGELIDRVTEISLNIRNDSVNPVIIKRDDNTKLDKISNFLYLYRVKIIIVLFLIMVIIALSFACFSVATIY